MEASNKKYYAFISYRHLDNTQPGRQWATWLHQAIETYDVPAELVGKKNARGEEIPARIFPIFRDEEALPADADLGSAISKALDESALLVVLCSPNARASTYVADEITYFKKIGRADNIIAAMIAGEPNTSLDLGKQAKGLTLEDECFPEPLQFEFDEHGNQTDTRTEPIAADFRVIVEGKLEEGWTSPEAFRQHLKGKSGLNRARIDKLVSDYDERLRLMLLKIIAGIIGVPLDDLTQRDKAYQLEIQKRKAKRLRQWLSAVAMLAILAIGAGVLAYLNQQQAQQNATIAEQRKVEAEKNLAQAYAGYGRSRLAAKSFEEAALFFAHAQALSPGVVNGHEEFEAAAESARKHWEYAQGYRFDSPPFVTTNGEYLVGKQRDFITLYATDNMELLAQYPSDVFDANSYLTVSENGQHVFELNLKSNEFVWFNRITKTSETRSLINDSNALLFIPSHNANHFLFIDASFNLSVFDVRQNKTVWQRSFESLAIEVPELAAYKDAILTEFVNYVSVNTLATAWNLTLAHGIRLRIPFTVMGDEDVNLLPPLKTGNSYYENVSSDGKYWFVTNLQKCWLDEWYESYVIVRTDVEVWDLSSGNLLHRKPFNWSQDIYDFTDRDACMEGGEALSEEDRRTFYIINNRGLQIDDIFMDGDEIKMLVAGQMQPMDAPLMVDHIIRFQNSSTYVHQHLNDNNWIINRRSTTGQNNDSEDHGEYWLYPAANDEALITSSVVDVKSSNDDRFVFSLSDNQIFQVLLAESGETIRRLHLKSSPSQLLCPTESSHEIILASPEAVTRYNWYKQEVVWKLPLDTQNTMVTSCDFDINSGHSAVVLLSNNNIFTRRDKSQIINTDENSQIIIISDDGKLVSRIQDRGFPLISPNLVRFTDDTNEILVSTLQTGIFKIAVDTQATLEHWVSGSIGTTISSIVQEPLSGRIFVGMDNGSLGELSDERIISLDEFPLPIVALKAKNGEIDVFTGIDPFYQFQQTLLVRIEKEDRVSKHYKFAIGNGTSRLHRTFGNRIIKYISFAALDDSHYAYSQDGKLSKVSHSFAIPNIFATAPATNISLIHIEDDRYLSLLTTPDNINITDSQSGESINYQLNGTLFHSVDTVSKDKKWLFIRLYYSQQEHDLLVVDLENLESHEVVTGFEEDSIEQLLLSSYDEPHQRYMHCEKQYCLILDLSIPLGWDTVYGKLRFDEEFRQVILLGDSFVALTASGKIQKWQINERAAPTLLNELTDHFYFAMTKDIDSQRILISGQSANWIMDEQLEVTPTTFPFNYRETYPVILNLDDNWLLTFESLLSGLEAKAIIIDLDSGNHLAEFSAETGLIFSAQNYDSVEGVIYWTGMDRNLQYLNLQQLIDWRREAQMLSDKETIEQQEALTGLRLIGVEAKTRPAYLTGMIVHSYATLNNTARDLGLKRKGWLSDPDDTLTLNNFFASSSIDFNFVIPSLAEELESQQLQQHIDELAETILEQMASNQDVTTALNRLKKLKSAHPVITLFEIKELLTENPYSALLAAQRFSSQLKEDLYVNLNTKLFLQANATHIQAATVLGEVDIVLTVLREFGVGNMQPQLLPQFVNLLVTLGRYDDALWTINGSLRLLRSGNADSPNNPAHQIYKGTERFAEFVEDLIDMRGGIQQLPILCLHLIQPGSPLSGQLWREKDCVLRVNNKHSDDPAVTWNNLMALTVVGGGSVTVLRNGAEETIEVNGNYQNGRWVVLGYEGVAVLEISTLEESSKLAKLGLQVGDYLVAADSAPLANPVALKHFFESTETRENLVAFRPTSKSKREKPEYGYIDELWAHPLAHWQGEWLTLEMPKSGELGATFITRAILAPYPVEAGKQK